MQKQAPSLARILSRSASRCRASASSSSSGSPSADRSRSTPESYRFTAYFPEATRLATEADVRIGGVSVGKVKSIELAPPEFRVNGKDVAAAEIELEPEFAPISTDARAILRQKTVVGETFVEITVGNRAGARRATSCWPRSRTARPWTCPRASSRPASRCRRAGASACSARRRRCRSTRSSTRSTRRRAWPTSAGSRAPPSRSATASCRVNDALGNLAPYITDASDTLDDPRRPGGGAARADPRRRDQLRGALVAPRGAHRGDPRPEEHLRGARRRGRGAGRDVRDPAHVPARDAGDARAPGRRSAPTRTRSSAR